MKKLIYWLFSFLLLSLEMSTQCLGSEDTSIVSLVAVGDVMLSRGVQQKITKYGANYPFEKVREVIREADIAFCNLECPVSYSTTSIIKENVFGVKPQEAKGLSYAGFDIVSLSNNHTLDKGRKGLLSTMEFLRKEGIRYVGAGDNYQQAQLPTILNQKGLKIAFLAYCLYPLEGIIFKEDAPGIAFYNPAKVKEALEKLKKDGDVIVVSLHWGTEYATTPSAEQTEIAHQIIDWGADLILGHHPHVVQKIEEYKGGVIVYSLGNFVFDQHKPETKKSIIFKAKLSRKGVVEYSILTAQIVRFQPMLKKD